MGGPLFGTAPYLVLEGKFQLAGKEISSPGYLAMWANVPCPSRETCALGGQPFIFRAGQTYSVVHILCVHPQFFLAFWIFVSLCIVTDKKNISTIEVKRGIGKGKIKNNKRL